jgi:penicillin-binding protein 1A
MRTLVLWSIGLFCALAVIGALLLGFCFIVITPGLPALDALQDYRPKVPLRIYSSDQVLLGEFGQERREFIPIKSIPLPMKQALLSIEDARFYEHPGVDLIGVLRAVVASTLSGHMRQGASTITMQVARDFFLTKDKLLLRKLSEVMLAYKIESALSKDQILELYMNQIYLGQRAYGFGSAARTYFGLPLQQLSVSQMALLAGLPQAPSLRNPVVDPAHAKQRQQVVLKRMHDLGYLTDAQFQAAKQEPLQLRAGKAQDSHAQYVTEMVRQAMVEQFKDDAYSMGLTVTTTINAAEQTAAWDALRRNVLAYDQRHGYRGAEGQITDQEQVQAQLSARPWIENLRAAMVLEASPKKVRATLGQEEIEISGEGLRFAANALSAGSKIRLTQGAIIRVTQDGKGRWQIGQLPQVAAAFVALDAQTGGYRALVGGFDYELSKFNHVTQAMRQPGSAMKPFIYSAAIEKGLAPGSMIEDTPLTIGGAVPWSPQNDDNVYDGAVSLRTALAKSKNVVAVRVLQQIGAQYGREFLPRFGFELKRQPDNLTLALGTGEVSPQQMVMAYSVFANGGYQLNPYLIQKVVDQRGKVLFEAKPTRQETDRVLDARNAFLVDTMLREVVRSGTGAAATAKLGRRDLAGKTGTTSDAVDGWFAGYSGQTVAVAWMGFDEPRSLGGREFGATLSLPIWIDYMRVARAKQPEQARNAPAGLTRSGDDWVYDEFLVSPASAPNGDNPPAG